MYVRSEMMIDASLIHVCWPVRCRRESAILKKRKGPVMNDLAQQVGNYLAKSPRDFLASVAIAEATRLPNHGAIQFEGRAWLLARVAESPTQAQGKSCFSILEPHDHIEVLEFDTKNPILDLSDPRVVNWADRDCLSTLPHHLLFASENKDHLVQSEQGQPLMGAGELETYEIRDCPVAEIDAIHYLTHTQVSGHGVGVGLRTTINSKDFGEQL
jgi:beta-1,2-mannobiose phosphorylase / 1,2-beta-oligomannan phosphorylase